MKIAVVVPVKNEIDGLGELVTSLLKQVSAGDELVFVDAGSTDGTRDLLREFAAKDPRVRLLVSEGAFPGKARNVAIRNTNADIIAQIDGGNHPDENWLQNIVAPILRGEADYSMGAVAVLPMRRRFLGRMMDMGAVYGASLHRGEFRNGTAGPPAGGASVAYLRWIWEKTGGFPEWLRFGSDPLYVRRIMPLHPRICYAGDAVLFWQLGPTLRHVFRRQVNREADKFHDPVTLRRGMRALSARVVMLFAMAVACVIPLLWIPLTLLLGALLALQTAKSVKTYCQRVKPEPPDLLRVLLIFPVLDGLGIVARFAGTVRGILWLRNARREWAARRSYVIRDYPV
jgi:glycosyltransferase involved in cell wall biosynthesis